MAHCEPKLSHKVGWRSTTALSRFPSPQVRPGSLQQRHALRMAGHGEDADDPERERDPLRSAALRRRNSPLTCGDAVLGDCGRRSGVARLCESKRAHSEPSCHRAPTGRSATSSHLARTMFSNPTCGALLATRDMRWDATVGGTRGRAISGADHLQDEARVRCDVAPTKGRSRARLASKPQVSNSAPPAAHHGARRCAALAANVVQFVLRAANLRVSGSLGVRMPNPCLDRGTRTPVICGGAGASFVRSPARTSQDTFGCLWTFSAVL